MRTSTQPPINRSPCKHDLEIAALVAVAQRIGAAAVLGRVRSAIPEHHRSAAVLSLRDRALERVVLDRMVFDLHRETLDARVVARALSARPSSSSRRRARGGSRSADDWPRASARRSAALARASSCRLALGLGRLAEVTLPLVLGERCALRRGPFLWSAMLDCVGNGCARGARRAGPFDFRLNRAASIRRQFGPCFSSRLTDGDHRDRAENDHSARESSSG